MKSSALLVFVSSVFFSHQVISKSIAPQQNLLFKPLSASTEKDNIFDYYVFTQQWPASGCITASSGDNCEVPANVTGWLIHGLWPSNFDGSYPAYCDDQYNFNDQELLPIWDQLVLYWTNLYMSEPVDSFWEHEWDKHGTCAYVAHDVSSEFDYFNTTLGFHTLYPIYQWLGQAGFVPDDFNYYSASDMLNAVSARLGKQAIFECQYDQDKKQHIVYQIEICLDRNFVPIDCQDPIKDCSSDGKVIYPVSRPASKSESSDCL